ncbi:type II secretion system minor pseudopilin GspI [Aliidiomarina sp. Khilg15.8]
MKRNGFTLIEVMLAMSIFAMAAVAALQVASGHLRNIGTLEERSFATMVAANRLAQVHASDTWPPQNGSSGEVELAERSWFWQQQTVETVTDDLREVTIIVRSEEDGPEQARLSGFVGRR